MADARRCPRCGAQCPEHAPEGLCPRCLLQNAWDPGSDEALPETSPVEPGGPSDVDPTQPSPTAVAGGSTRTAGGPEELGFTHGSQVRYFGDYEILDELGRGGMGVVYRARQVSLNRPVALKMLRAGVLADDAELRRFRNEAEAVALLDHPGIVPIYEIGVHEGRQYFTMRLVEGSNLAERLDRYRDDPRAAALLLRDVAEAVHHAHMRGILHRDLKPANVLVDGEGRPEITDFGLAKRVQAEVEFTASGAILGTPAYMAPEQAEGRRGGITTATDVHGLGAVLYALLSGRAPFAGDSVVDTLTRVKEQPPDRPSRLNPGVPRDLETICLKCLEKEARHRYSSAAALAEDLDAWLETRPIAARRVPAHERAWLWCKRRPAVAGLTAALLLAIVGGAITSTVLWLRAERNFRNEQAARREAQERFDLALEAIRTFHSGVSEEVLLQQPQFEEMKSKLLKQAADFYGKLRTLLRGSGSNPSARRALAEASVRLGLLTKQIGSREEAVRLFHEAIGEQAGLVRDEPEVSDHFARLGMMLVDLGNLLVEDGRLEEARSAFERALLELSKALKLEPANDRAEVERAAAASSLATIAGRKGDLEGCITLSREIVPDLERLAREHPEQPIHRRVLASVYMNIGYALQLQGRLEEAVRYTRRAVALQQRLVDDKVTPVRDAVELAGALTNLGHQEKARGRLVEASEAYRRARDLMEELMKTHATMDRIRSVLAANEFNLALVRGDMGDPAGALPALVRARDIQAKLVEERPGIVLYRLDVATAEHYLGLFHDRLGLKREALEHHRRARVVMEDLVKRHPEAEQHQGLLFDSCRDLGRSALNAARWDLALEALQEARAAYGNLRQPSPGARYDEACVLAMLSEAIASFGPVRQAEARELATAALAQLDAAIQAGFSNTGLMAGDPDLAALRRLPDFWHLALPLLDRAFPADPFSE